MVAQVVFYLLATLTVGSSMMVAFSRNIVYSTFALFGAFMGVVGIYVLLAADFVAMVQLLVYVGGILVLTIFAVMLTSGIADVTVSNREVGVVPSLVTVVILGAVMVYAVFRTPWQMAAPAAMCIDADHLRNRQRVPRRVCVAVRGGLAGAVGGAGRRDRHLAPRNTGITGE